MPAADLSLQKLLAPLSLDEFLSEHWERRYVHLDRDDPSYYGRLFSYDDFDRCLHVARELEREIVTVVPPAKSGVPGHKVSGVDISVTELYQAFNKGATLVIGSAERLWAPLAEVTMPLERLLGATVTVNAYLTPASSQGFDIHFDAHDVFVLQVEGAKEWSIYERFYEHPRELADRRNYLREQVRLQEKDKENLLETIRLERGDLFYLPRGFPHMAAATNEASLHLTVGIHPFYWLDLLKAAVEAVAEGEPALRRALPPGFVTDPEVRSRLGETFAEVSRTVAGSLAGQLDRALGALTRTALGQSPPPDGHFGQLTRLDEIDLETRLRVRDGLHLRLRTEADSAAISYGGSEVRGPAAIAPALEFVRDRQSFRLGDLPGLSDKSRLVLGRRLVGEGFLRIADDDAG